MARIQLKIWMAPLATLSQPAPAGLAEGEIAIASETNTLYKRPDGNASGALIPLGGASNQIRVKAATTTDITLSGPQTVDGVAVTVGDVVLVKNKPAASQNGLFTVGAGAWTRTAGADSWTSIVSMMVIVERGTVNADTVWVCTSDSGGTLGTTAISFLAVANATSAVLGSVTPAADSIPYFTGANTAGTTALTSFARTLLDDVDANAARNTLGAAPLASPALTGTPTAPTATAGTNTTQLATTAFVTTAVSSATAGAVASANKLTTARTITASGDATSSAVSFDGSANISIPLTLANSGVTAGTYQKLTVDAKGRVTAGASLSAADIPSLDWTKIATGKPTTLAGYGIADAATLASPALTGIPTAPTAAAGTNTAQLATTAFVQSALGGSIPSLTTSGSATIGGDLSVTGNLNISGTTTTFNSTTMTVDDPIMTLGGDTAPTADDGKDRGIEFRWHNGSASKVGFFGFDDSTGKFTFIPDAVNTSEVFSGATGTIVANLEGAVTGNASTATKLATARTITASGDATSSAVSFDGSANISIPLTLANSGVTAGTYPKVVVDAKGRVTAGATLVAADIPALDWSKITSGKPTTLAGYGITDSASLASPALTGTPTAPTAAAGTNTTQIATTAFVSSAISATNLIPNATYFSSRKTTGTAGRLLGIDANNLLYFGDIDNVATGITVQAAGAERLRIDNLGNFGFAKSNPAYRLDIATSTNGVNGVNIAGSNGGANEQIGYRATNPNSVGVFLGVNGHNYTGSTGSANNALLSTVGSVPLVMGTDSKAHLYLNTSGHLGLGSVPGAWRTDANSRAIQLPATALFSFSDSTGELITNAINDGTNFVHRVSYSALRYVQDAFNAKHSWYTAPSATAGQNASFTQLMVLDNNGNLGIGTATPDRKLVVNGDIGFTYNAQSTSANGLRLNGVKTVYFNGITSTATDVIHEFTGSSGATKLTITEGGHVGIGGAPSSWTMSGLNAIQLKKASVFGYANELGVQTNIYYDSSVWRYISASAPAAQYHQNSGNHYWYAASGGAADSIATLNQLMSLDSVTGNLNVPASITTATPTTSDSSTKVATTAFVKAQNYAPLASPALTGTPTAPTPMTTGDSSTRIATTAWVQGVAVTKDSATGAAVIPSGTTAQRPASTTAGQLRFNTTLGRAEMFTGVAFGSSWSSLGGATGAGTDAVFYLNSQTVTTSYTIPTGQNAMSAGPITIANGVTVTVSDGSTWTVV